MEPARVLQVALVTRGAGGGGGVGGAGWLSDALY